LKLQTGINIANDHLGAFFRKQLGGFRANALRGAGDDGDLAIEQALAVQVGRELGQPAGGRHCGQPVF
jgi:hypothetical protein